MADNQAEQLAEQTRVEPWKALRALRREDGDVEAARDRLLQAPSAVKIRFATQNDNVYGLLYLVVKPHPPRLVDSRTLVTNDRSVAGVQLNLSLEELKGAIDRLTAPESKMSAFTQRLDEALHETFSPPDGEWVELIEQADEARLQRRFQRFVADVVGEEEMVLTAEVERALIDAGGGEEAPEDQRTAPSSADTSKVELLCDLRVSPLRGHPVRELDEGDELYVSIKEDEGNHGPLLEVMEKLKDEATGMIPAPIRGRSRTPTGKLEFIVQFGENVYGRVLASDDMNVLTPQTANVSENTTQSPRNRRTTLPWIVIGIGIIVAGLALLWAIIFA